MLLKQGVWDNPHKYIRKLLPAIDKIFQVYNVPVENRNDEFNGLECIITSCGDSQHSIDSMHHLAESKAIDIRPPAINVQEIWNDILVILRKHEEKFGIKYLMLDEGNHWHIQVKE